MCLLQSNKVFLRLSEVILSHYKALFEARVRIQRQETFEVNLTLGKSGITTLHYTETF